MFGVPKKEDTMGFRREGEVRSENWKWGSLIESREFSATPPKTTPTNKKGEKTEVINHVSFNKALVIPYSGGGGFEGRTV